MKLIPVPSAANVSMFATSISDGSGRLNQHEGGGIFCAQYLEGKAEFNQKMLDSFLLCTTCQRCNQVCQVKIPIQQMWDQMRGLVIQEKGYHTFPGFEFMAASFRRQNNIWAGNRVERDSWLPTDVKPSSQRVK